MRDGRFQHWLATRAAGLSRRATLRAALVALTGATAALPGAERVTAKKNGNKRRRRLRERARARCLAACGPACAACFHTPDSEILCSQGATDTGGCRVCEADRDCPLGYRCVESEQARGDFRRERFIQCLDGHYPHGLCAEIAGCAPG